MKKDRKLRTIFSDADIIVVDKPSGLLSIPDRFRQDLPSVKTACADEYGDIFVVHRLDRETSGAMILARNAAAHRSLNMQFDDHKVRKQYSALVTGAVAFEEHVVDIPLDRDPRRPGLMKPSARGKEAITVLRIVEKYRSASLLHCFPKTGRQHQIRLHCATIGHPILCDADYGRGGAFMLSAIKRRYNLAKGTDERPVIARLTLHSDSVSFTHPATGEDVTYEAPWPRDFSAAVKVLRKYARHLPAEHGLW